MDRADGNPSFRLTGMTTDLFSKNPTSLTPRERLAARISKRKPSPLQASTVLDDTSAHHSGLSIDAPKAMTPHVPWAPLPDTNSGPQDEIDVRGRSRSPRPQNFRGPGENKLGNTYDTLNKRKSVDHKHSSTSKNGSSNKSPRGNYQLGKNEYESQPHVEALRRHLRGSWELDEDNFSDVDEEDTADTDTVDMSDAEVIYLSDVEEYMNGDDWCFE